MPRIDAKLRSIILLNIYNIKVPWGDSEDSVEDAVDGHAHLKYHDPNRNGLENE
jgi:hypothetical protein